MIDLKETGDLLSRLRRTRYVEGRKAKKKNAENEVEKY